MGNKIEILDCKTSVTIIPEESILISFIRDLLTIIMIAFAVYISKDSTFWTFISGSIFLLVTFATINKFVKETTTTFKSFDEAIEYLKNKREQ